MKRKLSIILALMLIMSLLLPVCAHAEETPTEGFFCGNEAITWSYDTETKQMTFTGSGALDMGESLDMVNVKGCYVYQKDAESIVVGAGITAIGDAALASFIKVKSVKLPVGLTRIGTYAFAGCTRLTSINLPAGLTSIGDFAFVSDLSSIRLPASLKSLGAYSLSSNTVESIKLPASLTKIGTGAFADCTKLKKITVASGNTSFVVKSGALYNKKGTRLVWVSPLKEGSFSIPEKVTNVSGALAGCSKITSVSLPSTFPATESALEDLTYMTGLKSITVSSKNTRLAARDGVLYNKKMTDLLVFPIARTGGYVMPSTLTCVTYDAFSGAKAITSVTIGKSMRYLDFEMPTNVKFKTFKADSANKYFSAKDGALYNKKGTKLIAFPAGRTGKFTVPKTVTVIGDMAFAFGRLSEVYIPNSVTSVGYNIFLNCSKLTSVRLSPNIKYLYGAFAGCKRLAKVTLPTALKQIDSELFNNCKSLTSVTIPRNVSSVEGAAFAGSGVTTVRVSKYNSKISYRDNAFFSKDGKTLKSFMYNEDNEVRIPDGTETLAQDCFYACADVGKIIVPASVTKVNRYSLGFSGATEIYFEGDCPAFGSMGYTMVDGEYVDCVNEFAEFGEYYDVKLFYHEGAVGFDKYVMTGCTLATY